MLVEYLFVYSEADHSFPVRLRVIREGEGADIPDADQLTGSVAKGNVEALMARLSQEYPTPAFRVAKSFANTWQAVARNYAGLDYDHFSSSPTPKGSRDPAPPAPDPASPPHPSVPVPPPAPASLSTSEKALLMETSASKSTKVFAFLGVVLFLGAAVVTWPEFSARYGSLINWAWGLPYNPSWALPGVMMPLCIGAGAYALYWFLYYSRVTVRVFDRGIQFQPPGRFVDWGDVEHIRYAQRYMRYTGSPRQALRLTVRGQAPVNLPHKFDDMERLVSLVRNYVEPVVLERVEDRLRDEGSVSFGKQITITPEHLMLTSLGVRVPLEQIGGVAIAGGVLQIFNADGRAIFSDTVEVIPDATVIPQLVTAVKRSAGHQAD